MSLVPLSIDRMLCFIKDIRRWMSSNYLQLNEGKTEIIFFGSRHRLAKLSLSHLDITIGSCKVKPATVVRNLGVLQDESLTMSAHIASLSRSCYAQLHCISRIRQFLTIDASKRIVQALIMSRLDYANVLLHAASANQLKLLQRIQNHSARLISGAARTV